MDYVVVGVQFKHESGGFSKTHSYKAPIGWELQPGDEAIADSPFNGMVVVRVVSTDLHSVGQRASKWLVQMIDKESYVRRNELEAKIENEVSRLRNIQAHQMAMSNLRNFFASTPEELQQLDVLTAQLRELDNG